MQPGAGLRTFFAAALVLALAGMGRADEAPVNCETAETTADLIACAKLDFGEADSDRTAALDAALQRMQTIDADLTADRRGAEAALQAAEAAWSTFRDQACTAEGFTVADGTMRPLVVLECRARLTSARANDLWAISEGVGLP